LRSAKFQLPTGTQNSVESPLRRPLKCSGATPNGEAGHSVRRTRAHFRAVLPDASNADDVPGTGLGLHIAKNIVHAHGNKIWVENEPKQGSEFFLTLPVVKQ
jgi:light-regulated signal transduction histidine kinase (bacteriophytochrome)